jgi:hypothetical protein
MATKRSKKTGGAKRKRTSTVKDLSLARRRGDATGAVKGGAMKRSGPRRADCEPMT